MANFNLASLTPSMLHKILSKVATTSIRDFGCARVSFPGFNAVGREDYFYKSADLVFFNDWLDQVNAVRTFRLKCYQLGNPEAIYLRDGLVLRSFNESVMMIIRDCWSEREVVSSEVMSSELVSKWKTYNLLLG
ncbi:hypothetical protein F2Q69_00052209 [Brassica cretica]|uniref:Uncharacterized protein n=1 Tax=Brassica cretica TaxID=69181 RepID=A0A8S9N2W6_BRACR|nr:hypothetical protein F2Q69_00052209 [Brassica cretica]